ncbi:uncharacterized protein LOC144864789 isoform X2 [Branchiostoma floridae x Branchiostoma japonicum]
MDRSSVACPHVIYRDNELMNMQSTRHPTRNVWYGRCPAPVTKGASLHRVHHQLQAKDLSVKRFYGLIGVFKSRESGKPLMASQDNDVQRCSWWN